MNELTINLNAGSKQPLYEQIYEYIKIEIQRGHIPPEEKLPSTRALSSHLQISRSTVDLAYEQLVSEGYIEAVPWKGYFVNKIEGLHYLAQEPADVNMEQKNNQEQYLVDFKPTGIDLDSFPYNTWRKLSKNVLLAGENELFQMGDPKGEWELRCTIANYLHQSRGVNCSPTQIIVGAGSEYLLILVSRMLGKRKIAMESPTYKQAYHILRNMEHTINMVPMDEAGLRTDCLKESDADVVYVMPSHQFPLGIVMPLKRRMELLAWAAENEERYIIEDDYDSEFRYKGKPIPALQGYDSKDKVIYLGTFSKSIAPAIRISYMVLPESLLPVYDETCGFYSSTVSRVDQMIVRDFINDGYYERHLNKMRAIYKGKHDILINGLKVLKDMCKIEGENAGVHMLLNITDGRSEEELITLAKEKGIRVYGLSDYYISKEDIKDTKLILGYANLKEDQIKMACKKLSESWI